MIINAVVTHSEAVKSCLTRAKLNEHTNSNRKFKDKITSLKIFHLLAFAHAATKFIYLFYLKFFNKVRRLIVLIDTLYEHKIRLVVLAAAPPTGIFTAGTTTTTTATNSTTRSATDESDAEVEAAGKFGVGGNQGVVVGASGMCRQ